MSVSSRASSGAFSPVTMIIVLLVGVVALAGFGMLSAYLPELKSGNDGGGHALSRASTGFGGLPPLLRGLGQPVVLNRGEMTDGAAGSLLVLTPSVGTDSKRIADISHAGPILIVLPKWVAMGDPRRRGWVQTVDDYPARDVLKILPRNLRSRTTITETKGRSAVDLRRPDGSVFGGRVSVEGLRTISGPEWIPVVIDARGKPVLVMHRSANTYVLADPDFLSTHGLKTFAGARTAVDLLGVIRAQDAPVVFDLTLHGLQRSRNLLRLLVEPPMLGMTLVMAALAAFAGFQAAIRFGPARETGRVVALGKRALAENTAALVRMAKREHHMAAPYALLVRSAVARAIGAPRSLDDDALNAFLDRVGRITGATDTYSALAEQARAARTPGDLMRVAGSLHRWNQELTRASQ